jgi:hypothetical protein
MADAAADVKRFDEQLVQVERPRRIAGRERDDHHLSVSRGAVPRQFLCEDRLMDLARRRARELCRVRKASRANAL